MFKIADFFAEIGFKVDTKSLQQFNSSMSEVVGTVRGLATGLTATLTAWQLTQTQIGRNAQNLLNFKTYTGESVEEIRKLAAVMQGTNLNFSMDTLINDISTVKSRLRELQIFGEGSSMAQALRVVGLPGINPGAISTVQDFLKMLKQIPDAATRTMLAERMGLSKQFLNILDLTDKQYKELESRADKIFPNEEELKRRQKASLEIYMTWLELKNLFETKITDFAPILDGILHKIVDIVSDSQKLNAILEGVKWTFILTTLAQIATTLGVIIANVRTLGVLIGTASGVALAQKYNEAHDIDNLSEEGMRNQAIGGAAGTVGGVAGVWGLSKMWNSLKEKIAGTKVEPKAATKAATSVEEKAARSATRAMSRAARREARKLGKQAGAKAAKGAIGKAVAKAGARQAAAGAGNINPYVAGGLAVWGITDIVKAIYDTVKENKQQNNVAPTTEGVEGEQKFDWNSTLASVVINAQDVYISANRVNSMQQNSSLTGDNFYDTQQQFNIMRSRYNMIGNW